MPSRYHDKQKSLKRRFLLILGGLAFVCYLTFGFAIIFWDKLLPDYGYKKTLFGILLIIYGTYRFVRMFKKQEDDEE